MAVNWAEAAILEPTEDAALMEAVEAGRRPQQVSPLEVPQAHGARLLPRVGRPRRDQAQEEIERHRAYSSSALARRRRRLIGVVRRP
uniref:Uncharacterized protein n=1 Tax=Oryza rufipogon TaxID=4529 RepID=A0A0E0RDF7_ORYRU